MIAITPALSAGDTIGTPALCLITFPLGPLAAGVVICAHHKERLVLTRSRMASSHFTRHNRSGTSKNAVNRSVNQFRTLVYARRCTLVRALPQLYRLVHVTRAVSADGCRTR